MVAGTGGISGARARLLGPHLMESTRLLLYAHDTYGLGHLRRNLAIANYVSENVRNVTTLLVTGSPVAGNFPLPHGADYVKLPSVVKTGELYGARDLLLGTDQIVELRASIIAGVCAHYRPHIVLVDHAPTGMKGELIPALQLLRREFPQTHIALGLRDIIDDPAKIRRLWAEDGTQAAILRYYDRVLVYGQQNVFDPVREYAFEPELTERTTFCGYVRREDAVTDAATLRSELGLGDRPFALVTAGGGGDGVELFEASLDALQGNDERMDLDVVAITGPLMTTPDRERVAARIRNHRRVNVLPFHPDVPGLMRASAVTIAMGGYNTVCELLAAQCPAVVVPREHPRREQFIRAERLARIGLLSMLAAESVTSATLAAAIEGARHSKAGAYVATRWNDRGLPVIADHLVQTLQAQAMCNKVPA